MLKGKERGQIEFIYTTDRLNLFIQLSFKTCRQRSQRVVFLSLCRACACIRQVKPGYNMAAAKLICRLIMQLLFSLVSSS